MPHEPYDFRVNDPMSDEVRLRSQKIDAVFQALQRIETNHNEIARIRSAIERYDPRAAHREIARCNRRIYEIERGFAEDIKLICEFGYWYVDQTYELHKSQQGNVNVTPFPTRPNGPNGPDEKPT
jgi:hypothetical protein